MTELTGPMKQAIVLAHATFTPQPEIVAMMRNDFGVELTIRQVGGYDPSRSYYEAGDKWLAIFEAAREKYLKDVSVIPIGNQAYRLNQLNRLHDKALASGNTVLAASLLEQAAKEVGGVLTNERNLKVDRAGGKFSELTPEERRSAVADMFREAFARDKAQTAPTTEATQ